MCENACTQHREEWKEVPSLLVRRTSIWTKTLISKSDVKQLKLVKTFKIPYKITPVQVGKCCI